MARQIFQHFVLVFHDLSAKRSHYNYYDKQRFIQESCLTTEMKVGNSLPIRKSKFSEFVSGATFNFHHYRLILLSPIKTKKITEHSRFE